MSALVQGVVEAALIYGYNTRIQKAPRSFGNFNGDFKNYIIFEEMHEDEMEITTSPIEQGAAITDHAYKLPAKLTLKIGWSNSPNNSGLLGGIRGLLNTGQIVTSNLLGQSSNQINEIYQKLLQAQIAREPMGVSTGKRQYYDMLIKTLQTTTDKNTENVLMITVNFQQIIRVTTSILTAQRVPPANQFNPSSTQAPIQGGVKQLVPSPTVNAPVLQNFISPR